MNYIWSITDVSLKTLGETEDVVTTVYYEVTGEESGYKGFVPGVKKFNTMGDSFISYDDLKEDTIISWIKSEISDSEMNDIETAIKAQIEKSKDKEYKKALPWSN